MPALLVHAPAAFANLTLFPLESSARSRRNAAGNPASRDFLVLEEALAGNQAHLFETGEVGALEIENLADQDLFLQAGDIVKGGWQDRTLGADWIVPARSGRLRIPAFCVEHGRWGQRRGESAAAFSTSTDAVASKELRVALRKTKSQGAVWEEVAKLQSKLEESVAAPVHAAESQTSLQLSLETASVRRRLDDYLAGLAPALERCPGSRGFAFAIDGRLTGAELYATPALFRKLAPKLLRAAATEALAALAKSGPGAADPAWCDVAAVSQWLGETRGRKARRRREQITPRISLVTRENAQQISFETLDAAQNNQCIHQSILSH
jgi:hypothetical protein